MIFSGPWFLCLHTVLAGFGRVFTLLPPPGTMPVSLCCSLPLALFYQSVDDRN